MSDKILAVYFLLGACTALTVVVCALLFVRTPRRVTLLEEQLAEVATSAQKVYAAIPPLPIVADTAEGATDAFVAFCHEFNEFLPRATGAAE